MWLHDANFDRIRHYLAGRSRVYDLGSGFEFRDWGVPTVFVDYKRPDNAPDNFLHMDLEAEKLVAEPGSTAVISYPVNRETYRWEYVRQFDEVVYAGNNFNATVCGNFWLFLDFVQREIRHHWRSHGQSVIVYGPSLGDYCERPLHPEEYAVLWAPDKILSFEEVEAQLEAEPLSLVSMPRHRVRWPSPV